MCAFHVSFLKVAGIFRMFLVYNFDDSDDNRKIDFSIMMLGKFIYSVDCKIMLICKKSTAGYMKFRLFRKKVQKNEHFKIPIKIANLNQ